MLSFKEIKSDLPAAIVVFLVAVPLCLGIAMASGAPLFSGIIAGIAGGIIVTLISGSQLGVSGPAAGLAVIVLNAIDSLGSFQVFLSAVVIAGVLQVILGLVKAGTIGYYFPSSVIKGMLAGIGVIIILKQIPHAFGYDADYEGDMNFVQPDGENTFSELVNAVNYVSPAAIIISVISLFILILWDQVLGKKKMFQLIQGPLVVVLTGIGLNLLFQNYFPSIYLNENHLVTLPVANNFGEFIGQFTFPDFSRVFTSEVLVVAGTLAIVASLESLLSLEATDKLDPYKRISPASRELVAQGFGNLASGFIGGLPVTQVIVRSSANIQSGGRTKLSAFLHGLMLLGCVVAIPHVLNLIPLASLAAILFVVGYKLAKPALFKVMYRSGWSQFLPFVVTIVAIVFTDLLTGIAIGMVVAVFFLLKNNYHVSHHMEVNKSGEGKNRYRLVLAEEVTFLNKGVIMRTLRQIPDNSKVEIDISRSAVVDFDIMELLQDFRETAYNKDIEVSILDKERGQKVKPSVVPPQKEKASHH